MDHLKARRPLCLQKKKKRKENTFTAQKRLISTAGCLTVTMPQRFLIRHHRGAFHLKAQSRAPAGPSLSSLLPKWKETLTGVMSGLLPWDQAGLVCRACLGPGFYSNRSPAMAAWLGPLQSTDQTDWGGPRPPAQMHIINVIIKICQPCHLSVH